MPTVTLANQQIQLIIDPDHGASILAFLLRRGAAWLPLMPDVRNGEAGLAASNFLLAPYSNRIENGRFTFQGCAYQLAHAERHASHGDVRNRPWQVEQASTALLQCSFDSRTQADVNWPWPFLAQVEYRLTENVLASRLVLTNLGELPMPAGLGWHPYYSRWLTHPGEPVHLCFQVQGVYPDANDNRIPSGPPQRLTPQQNFAVEKALLPDNFIDICCYGYNGNGWISWPESGVKLVYRASAACTHLIFYNPAKPYFAVEPVTNANNGVNLLAQGDPTNGIQVLQPEERLEATFDLHLEQS
jgi:aldose 1-epimerase